MLKGIKANALFHPYYNHYFKQKVVVAQMLINLNPFLHYTTKIILLFTYRLADNDIPYMDIVKDLQSVRLDVQWELEIVPANIQKRKWLAMMSEHYPPQMEIMSKTEMLGGIRELTEGMLKYEGETVRIYSFSWFFFFFFLTRRSLSLVSLSGAAYSGSYLACFARTRFALTKIFNKKNMSQSTQNALKRI